MIISNEQLQVTIDNTVSINDLVNLQMQGFSVLRSAHVGNFSAYNLALAQAGITILAVDHNITGFDKNYFPESISTQQGSKTIAASGKLACRAVTENGQFVDELQLNGVRQALPSAQLFTNTDYLRSNESVVREIVDLLKTKVPQSFDRLVTPNGSTTKMPGAVTLLDSCGIMQLLDNPRAERMSVIMPNIADILANFVIEALKTERAVQYHLSGPAMFKYIGGLIPNLTKLYGYLRETASFRAQLPALLEVRLVPSAQAKFATTNKRQSQLDRLLSVYEASQAELSELTACRRAFFISDRFNDSTARSSLLSDQKRQQAKIETDLAECVAQQPELFLEPGNSEAGFITQYDCIAEGGLYVPPANREKSMDQLAIMSKALKKISERTKI